MSSLRLEGGGGGSGNSAGDLSWAGLDRDSLYRRLQSDLLWFHDTSDRWRPHDLMLRDAYFF